MRIAVPINEDQTLSRHFGRSAGFVVFDVDGQAIAEHAREMRRDADCHSLPQMLRSLEVNMVLAGGMGGGAIQRLAQFGIDARLGYDLDDPTDVVRAWIADPDFVGQSPCNHDHDHHHHHGEGCHHH